MIKIIELNGWVQGDAEWGTGIGQLIVLYVGALICKLIH